MDPDETLDVVRDAARWFEPGLDGGWERRGR